MKDTLPPPDPLTVKKFRLLQVEGFIMTTEKKISALRVDIKVREIEAAALREEIASLSSQSPTS